MKQVTFQGERSSLPRILSIMVKIQNPVWPLSASPFFCEKHATVNTWPGMRTAPSTPDFPSAPVLSESDHKVESSSDLFPLQGTIVECKGMHLIELVTPTPGGQASALSSPDNRLCCP